MRALLKLEQVLPPRLRHRVMALHGFVVPIQGRGPTVDANLLSSIAGACRDCECIRFKYQDRAGSASMRAVEPHRLVHTGYRWYLVAWDLSRDDWRTFRIDRIDGKPKSSTRFKPRKPPEGDFAKFVSKSLSQVPYPVRARITLQAPLESLTKRIPPSAGVLESIDGQSCLLQTGSYSVEGIAMHLSWLGVDFRVHEPPELIEHIRKMAGRFNASVA